MKKERESLVSIPEVKEMVQTAQRYIADDASVIELHGASALCEDWATRFELHEDIIALAKRWRQLADATWNEWGMNKNPLTPQQLKVELKKDLGKINEAP